MDNITDNIAVPPWKYTNKDVDTLNHRNNTENTVTTVEIPKFPISLEISSLINSLEPNSMRPRLENSNLLSFMGSSSTFEVHLDQVAVSSSSFRMEAKKTVMSLPLREFWCYSKIESRCFGCWKPKKARQTLFIDNGKSKLSVIYHPEHRIMDIFAPGRVERIGWIESDGTVGNYSKIYAVSEDDDVIFPRLFMMTRNTGDNPLAVTIQDQWGRPVASGEATDSTNVVYIGNRSTSVQRFVNKFQFTISDDDISEQTRVVLLATFATMMHDRTQRGKISKKRQILFVAVILSSVLLWITYLCYKNYLKHYRYYN